MTSEDNVQRIEVSMDEAKRLIEKRAKLQRLTQNQDFIDIIDEGYFVKEASRAVLLKASPNMNSPESQKLLDDLITGIGQLRQYFFTITHMANTAEKSLIDLQETRQELLEEEAVNG